MTGRVGSPVGRDRALDAFRGATVAAMILVNNPGSWAHLYAPLAHAPWHGCTPTDLVFPFFLFVVGASLALTLPTLRVLSTAAFTRRILQRCLVIFGVGLFLNAAPFVRWDEGGDLVVREADSLRIMGVLQRIALCFGVAAVIAWWGGIRAALCVSAGCWLMAVSTEAEGGLTGAMRLSCARARSSSAKLSSRTRWPGIGFSWSSSSSSFSPRPRRRIWWTKVNPISSRRRRYLRRARCVSFGHSSDQRHVSGRAGGWPASASAAARAGVARTVAGRDLREPHGARACLMEVWPSERS